MKIQVAMCLHKHCGRLFVLGYYKHCPDCYPSLIVKDESVTPWKYICWIDDGNLLIWHESQV